MKYRKETVVVLAFSVLVGFAQCRKNMDEKPPVDLTNPQMIADGKENFRHDTFGDEDFWSGLLHIDKAIAGGNNGGYGPGVSPKTALAVGLKVDADALPAAKKQDLVEYLKSL
jgi:hypothetical protein